MKYTDLFAEEEVLKAFSLYLTALGEKNSGDPILFEAFKKELIIELDSVGVPAQERNVDNPKFLRALAIIVNRLRTETEVLQSVVPIIPTETIKAAAEQIDRFPGAYRRKFAESLASNFIKQTYYRALVEKVADAAERAQSPDDFNRRAQDVFAEATGASAPAGMFEQARPEIEAIFTLDQKTHELAQETFNGDVSRVDIKARLMVEKASENPALSIHDVGLGVTKITKIAEALTADSLPSEPIDPDGFFQSLAGNNPVQKAGGAAADWFLTRFPERRDAVIESFLGIRLENVLGARRAEAVHGAAFVASPLFQHLKTAAPKPKPLGRGGRFFVGVLTGPVGKALIGNPDSLLDGIIELAALGAFSEGSPAVAHARSVQLGAHPTSFLHDIHFPTPDMARLKTFFSFKPEDVRLAIFAFTNQSRINFLPGVGWLLGLGARGAGARAAGAGLAAGLGRLGLAFFTGGTGLLVQAASWLGGLFLGKIFGGIKDVFTGTRPPRQRSAFETNFSTWLAVGVIAVIVILILPFSPFNMTQTVRQAALVTSADPSLVGIGGRAGTPTKFTNPYPVFPPASTISTRPVVGGNISQNPFSGPTHQNSNAVDIAVQTGTDIKATHDGYLVTASDGILPGQFGSGGLGNYVVLVGTAASGETYYTIYGHLLASSDLVIKAQSAPKEAPVLIRAGETIGKADATGNVFSIAPGGDPSHVHYECQGAACPPLLPT